MQSVCVDVDVDVDAVCTFIKHLEKSVRVMHMSPDLEKVDKTKTYQKSYLIPFFPAE